MSNIGAIGGLALPTKYGSIRTNPTSLIKGEFYSAYNIETPVISSYQSIPLTDIALEAAKDYIIPFVIGKIFHVLGEKLGSLFIPRARVY